MPAPATTPTPRLTISSSSSRIDEAVRAADWMLELGPGSGEHGGRVVNVAVDLNGQPPIQVFAKVSDKPEIVLRSIDLGVELRVNSYAQLDTYAQPGSEFGLAKAAFALAGFLPRFHAHGGFQSVRASSVRTTFG